MKKPDMEKVTLDRQEKTGQKILGQNTGPCMAQICCGSPVTHEFGRAWKMVTDEYRLDAATSSGILKTKQKLGVTFNSDKLGGIDFTKLSKLSMCIYGNRGCGVFK